LIGDRAVATELTPILEIAREILKEAGLKGLHVDDIAAKAVIRSSASYSIRVV
jgi:hypothetical protein